MGSEQLTAIEVMYKILSSCRSFCELNFDSQICSFKNGIFNEEGKNLTAVWYFHCISFAFMTRVMLVFIE